MAIPQSTTDAMLLVDTETNNLATAVLALRDKINTSMTQADVDAVNLFLTDHATRLQGIGKDPVAPIPPGPAPVFGKKK